MITHSLRCGALALMLLVAKPAAAAATLAVGCPWIPDAIDSGKQNSGYPDKAGNYSIAALPTAPASGSTLVIHGSFPQLRYFSFQIADRDRSTPPYDQIADAALVPDEGGTASTDPAQLPQNGNYTLHYTITVRFIDAPTVRQANTLYAGAPVSGGPVKQLLMRNYLPNPGTDTFGNTPLPTLTLVTAQGSTNLNQTPDTRQCRIYKAVWTHVQSVYNPVSAPATPAFQASSGSGLVLYPNGDSHYVGAAIDNTLGDLVVVRSKAPSFPPVPPAQTPLPNVRYWSACQNELKSTASVACIADRNMVVQSDGYFTLVISLPNLQPPLATPAMGYNWLTWGNAQDGLIVLRQILPGPGFAGDYLQAIDNPDLPLSTTLGVWAPDISYCDSATFAANATRGGAAVMQACHAATGS